MKNLNKTLVLAVALLLLISINGCDKKGCTDYDACNYNTDATKDDGSCDFSCYNCVDYLYQGSGSCTNGVIVGPGSCCPSDYPYFCSATNKCYSSCKSASNACTGGTVTKGLSSTGGGGGSAGYNCNGSSCTYVSSGAQYSTQSACQSACGGGGTCNYTTWSGTGSCSSGWYPVYTGKCCSSSYPYYSTGANSCYQTCSAAKSAGGSVYYINTSGGGGTCSSTNYTGSGSCSSGSVLVSSGKCCPSSSPYYCSSKNSCFATCADAASGCSGTVYKGTSSGSSGGGCSSSDWATWNSYGQVVENKYTTAYCGNTNDVSVKVRNGSNQQMDIRICIQKVGGTWDCGLEWCKSSGGTMSYWSCKSTGSVKYYLRPCNSTCPFPNP
ncbi:MAG: hypothetical protein KF872_11105 [Chitinophagales bacterium]|nr:hypothetical protein [Chitinophagales bacterium]